MDVGDGEALRSVLLILFSLFSLLTRTGRAVVIEAPLCPIIIFDNFHTSLFLYYTAFKAS
jgi:hypothetical protein